MKPIEPSGPGAAPSACANVGPAAKSKPAKKLQSAPIRSNTDVLERAPVASSKKAAKRKPTDWRYVGYMSLFWGLELMAAATFVAIAPAITIGSTTLVSGGLLAPYLGLEGSWIAAKVLAAIPAFGGLVAGLVAYLGKQH